MFSVLFFPFFCGMIGRKHGTLKIRMFWKKLLRYLLKPLSFLPALLMMYLIFNFSAQNGDLSGQLSGTVTTDLVELCDDLFDQGWTTQQILHYADILEHYVRKAAHVTEYFLLAVTVAFPLYVYRLRGWRLVLSAGFFCMGFACLDEWHQSFVPGRSPAFRDVLIDTAGSLAGIYATRIICWIGRRTIFRPLSMEKLSMEKNRERRTRHLSAETSSENCRRMDQSDLSGRNLRKMRSL